MRKIKNTALSLVGTSVLALAGCSGDPMVIQKYEGKIPNLGYTKIEIDTLKGSPYQVVWIECEKLSNTNLPFQRHVLVDRDGDGRFDEGTFPYRPAGTNISMRRDVYRGDTNNSDFARLEDVAIAALAARGTYLESSKYNN